MIEKFDYTAIDDEIRLGNDIFIGGDNIITTVGSARVHPASACYKYAYDLCHKLGQAGFSIMTGGGPGIMEASAKGAFDAGAVTYGINIELPHEQLMNPYITKPFVCNSLLSRKHLLINNASGFVVFEGGYGSLDELFEVLTLISTRKMELKPIVLAGSEFWNGLKDWVNNCLLKRSYISTDECNYIYILDDPDEIVAFFKKNMKG